jgi:hypothetical protein
MSGKREPWRALPHQSGRSLNQVSRSPYRVPASRGEHDDPGSRSSVPGLQREIFVAMIEILVARIELVVAITEIVVPPAALERGSEGTTPRSPKKVIEE